MRQSIEKAINRIVRQHAPGMLCVLLLGVISIIWSVRGVDLGLILQPFTDVLPLLIFGSIFYGFISVCLYSGTLLFGWWFASAPFSMSGLPKHLDGEFNDRLRVTARQYCHHLKLSSMFMFAVNFTLSIWLSARGTLLPFEIALLVIYCFSIYNLGIFFCYRQVTKDNFKAVKKYFDAQSQTYGFGQFVKRLRYRSDSYSLYFYIKDKQYAVNSDGAVRRYAPENTDRGYVDGSSL